MMLGVFNEVVVRKQGGGVSDAEPFSDDELADPMIGGGISPRARATIDDLRARLAKLLAGSCEEELIGFAIEGRRQAFNEAF